MTKKSRFLGLLSAGFLTASMATVWLGLTAGTAFAATTATGTVGASVSGGGDKVSLNFGSASGTVTVGSTGSVSSVNLVQGAGTSTSASDLITFADDTGTLAGWTLTLQATPLTEVAPSGGFASGTSAIVLPKTALELSTAEVYFIGESNQMYSSDPTYGEVIDYPDDGSPTTLATAAAGDGAGQWGLRLPAGQPFLTANFSAGIKSVDTVNYPSAPTPYSSTITVTMAEN